MSSGFNNKVLVTVKIISLEKRGWKPDGSGLESDQERESRNWHVQLIFLKSFTLKESREAGGSYKEKRMTGVCFIFQYREELEQAYMLCGWAKGEKEMEDVGERRLTEEGKPWADEKG